MNIFQMQAELSRQWLELSLAMARTALDASTALTQQAAHGWMQSARATMPAASPMLFMPSPLPMHSGWPTPLSTPFAAAWAPAFSAALWPWQAALGMRSWAMPPAAAFGAPLVMWPWLWASALPGAGHGILSSGMPRTPGTEIIEQMAASYRTASGYAAAAVMLPLSSALAPRQETTLWWPFWPSAMFGRG